MKPYINSNYRFRPQSVACQCKVSCGIGTATCEAFPEWKGTRLAKVLPWLRRFFVTVGAFDFHRKFVVKPTLPGASCVAVSLWLLVQNELRPFSSPFLQLLQFQPIGTVTLCFNLLDFIKVNGWANSLGCKSSQKKPLFAQGLMNAQVAQVESSGILMNSPVYLYPCNFISIYIY